MRYPGGKNSPGTFHRIINEMPPHTFYCEPFAGSAAVARLKRPAAETLLLDLDAAAIGELAAAVPWAQVLRRDGLAWLYDPARCLGQEAVIYCDPPYLAAVCASDLRYRHVTVWHGHNSPGPPRRRTCHAGKFRRAWSHPREPG